MKEIFNTVRPSGDFAVVRDELTAQIPDEKPYIFHYDLSFDNGKTVGVCALSGGKLFFKEKDSETVIIDLKTLGEIRFVQLWGCIALE